MLSETITQAINQAEKYRYITKVGIFGSHARGEAHSDSDIDVLIDYDSSSDDFLDDLDNFMEDFESAVHCKIDYVTLFGLQNSGNENFKQEVLKDVKWIYTAKGA